MGEQQTFTLPAGTVCKRNSIPFTLQHATQIDCHPGVWPLIKGEPPELEGEAFAQTPPPFKPSAGAVVEALKAARLALLSHDNCLITDRADLPRSAETCWTTDFSRQLQLIDVALDSANRRSTNSTICHKDEARKSGLEEVQRLLAEAAEINRRIAVLVATDFLPSQTTYSFRDEVSSSEAHPQAPDKASVA
ncbi:hypothetical protein [Comamonas sp.]|uniref:hypothetical protein n=1 Tax=Comamonas sp. TaxID=34028 RepID=UPI002FCA29EC